MISGSGILVTSIAYDNSGNVVQTQEYMFRPRQSGQSRSGTVRPMPNFTFSYTYDNANHLLSVTNVMPGGKQTISAMTPKATWLARSPIRKPRAAAGGCKARPSTSTSTAASGPRFDQVKEHLKELSPQQQQDPTRWIISNEKALEDAKKRNVLADHAEELAKKLLDLLPSYELKPSQKEPSNEDELPEWIREIAVALWSWFPLATPRRANNGDLPSEKLPAIRDYPE